MCASLFKLPPACSHLGRRVSHLHKRRPASKPKKEVPCACDPLMAVGLAKVKYLEKPHARLLHNCSTFFIDGSNFGIPLREASLGIFHDGPSHANPDAA